MKGSRRLAKREIDRTMPKQNSVLVEASSVVVNFLTHGRRRAEAGSNHIRGNLYNQRRSPLLVSYRWANAPRDCGLASKQSWPQSPATSPSQRTDRVSEPIGGVAESRITRLFQLPSNLNSRGRDPACTYS